ncbi:MAG: PAS domain-containing sensor histidine kinase [Phycisphaerales bacterium]|nr:PAS domain-containing sensor histidine kinase [Phycisphaerales bacterium]
MSNAANESTFGASGDFHRLLCRDAAIAMVAADSDFNIRLWNQSAVKLLGPQVEQMQSQPLSMMMPADMRDLFDRLLERTVTRMETSEFDVRMDDVPHGPKDLTVFLSPVPDADGVIQGLSAWIIDQTRHVQIAQKLDKAEEMASLGTLASGVAHHFNSILGGVSTFVDFALTSGDEASMKRALQMTADASLRASRLTQSLLSFVKHESHRSDLADLTEVILTFAHLVEAPLTDKKIELDLHLHPVAVVAVEANRMHQILGNLLTNAEEAMPDGGMIRLTVGQGADESEAMLTFADNGIGIPNENLEFVFDPFFTTKGMEIGGEQMNPGLGLSVAQGIVLEMGGKISVRTRKTGGTEFIIKLPVNTD